MDKLGYPSPGLVAGATGALTRAFTIFDSCPIKLNQPWIHSPLILPFISLLKSHQWHQTYRNCSSAGAASSTHASHILLAPLYCKKIIVMMKKEVNLLKTHRRHTYSISNVNSMSKIYCSSFRCIVLLQHRKQFKNSIYKEKCNNTCAFYALSQIISLYSNKCYLRVLNQYWRILMYF